MTIHELIAEVRRRPSLYLPRLAVNDLRTLIHGWTIGRGANAEDRDFLAKFQRYVEEHFRINNSQGWAKIITFYSMQEDQELGVFFSLYDDFMQRSANEHH